ncbi:MAG: LysM peptidoglycan-binding domain-containing protein [Bacteroidaceae bacterium]|nr:LysM peptidoglycan-binding domain-containing protein [Bacteroidaceae bacterium]
MRYLFTILCCLFVATITAQQTTHIVGKGETPVTIAEKYQITVEELQQSNPLVKNFYAGMKINLPANAKRLSEVASNNYTSKTPTRAASAYIRHAETHIANDEYKKAIKELDHSIEEQPSFQAYWLRGLSYYNLGKWDKAMTDLRAVMVDEAGNHSIRTEAERLYANASQNLEEKREKRNQFWGEILATVGVIAVQAGQQAMYNESMKSSGSLFNDDGTINEAEYNKMLQRSYVNAQIQTQQQIQSEFNQFNALHMQLYGKEATWEDFTSYKAQSANAASNMNDFNSSSTGLDMNSSSSSSTYEPSFVKESKACSFCKGTGINPGKEYAPRFGTATKVHCSTCGDYDYPHHHEKCPSCNGKGYIESMKRK